MSGSGQSQVVINPRERAVSTDINRLQAFQGRAMSDFLRQFFLSLTNNDGAASGFEIFGNPATDSPLPAAIISGIRFRPELATVNAFIEPGALVADFPETPQSPDDSTAKLIVDPGVQTTGVLTLTPNGSGSRRIDIIECRPILSVLETDNRDVFDPSTGLFTAVTVDKVRSYRLQYRIRTGTPAAGFPGLVVGWLPLAVCSVPSPATTWDDVLNIWDVRPMVADRVNGPMRNPQLYARMLRNIIFSDVFSAPGVFTITGEIEADAGINSFGGIILPTGPLSLNGITNPDIVDPTFTIINNIPYYLYLLSPFNLPRWAKYTAPGFGSRIPSSPRGIPVVSNVAPLQNTHTPIVPIVLPTSLGFAGASTTVGVNVMAGPMNGGAVFGVHSAGRIQRFTNYGVLFYDAASSTLTSSRWTLVPGISHPPNARTVFARLTITFSTASAVEARLDNLLTLSDPTFTNVYWDFQGPETMLNKSAGGSPSPILILEVEIPVVGSLTYGLELTYSAPAGLGVPTNARLRITGWDTTP